MAYSHHDNEAHRMQRHAEQKQLKSAAARVLVVGVGLVVAFGAVSVQLVRLAARGQVDVQLAAAAPLTTSFSRPDIIDRHGRILATDVAAPSLYADPKNVLSVDETMERLSVLLPGIDTPELREILADKSRRFVWVKRRLSTALAQKIHELGLPGLVFRAEPQRSYPQARVAGHILGLVNIYNKGLSGLEHYIDEELGVERVPVARVNTKPPVRLSIDIPAQYALEQELQSARRMYRAKAASGVVLDVATGEVAAAASVPGVDPALAEEVLAKRRINRFANDVFELGSVFKTVTVAMAVELRLAGLDTIVDTTRPLTAGPFTIKDYHPAGRPLTVREVFVRSSNVGAGQLALAAGVNAQQAFLKKLGLSGQLDTEAGPVATPKLPQHWGRAANITVSYGHGIAVSPLQFTAAAAALVNGGNWMAPTFLARSEREGDAPTWRRKVLRDDTSAAVRKLMRLNVTSPSGSGRRADVPGYRVGGKTGTADLASDGTYDGKSVVTSFVAAFPMDAPRYVVLITLFGPKGLDGNAKRRTAGLNAAPTAGRVIARLAPLLGVMPRAE